MLNMQFVINRMLFFRFIKSMVVNNDTVPFELWHCARLLIQSSSGVVSIQDMGNNISTGCQCISAKNQNAIDYYDITKRPNRRGSARIKATKYTRYKSRVILLFKNSKCGTGLYNFIDLSSPMFML